MLVFPSLNPKPFTPFTPIPIPSILKLSSTQAKPVPSTTCVPYSTEANLSRPSASTSNSLWLNLSRQLNSLSSLTITGYQRTPTTTTMRHPTSLIISLHMTVYAQILIPATIFKIYRHDQNPCTSFTPIPHPSKPKLNFDLQPHLPQENHQTNHPTTLDAVFFFPPWTVHPMETIPRPRDLFLASSPCFQWILSYKASPANRKPRAFCLIRRGIFCANFSAG